MFALSSGVLEYCTSMESFLPSLVENVNEPSAFRPTVQRSAFVQPVSVPSVIVTSVPLL